MGWTINQNYDLNVSDASEWNNRTLEELKQMHRNVHAKFADAQVLINALNALDGELAMEIQEREMHPEDYPEPNQQIQQQPTGVVNQVFGQGPIMAPAESIQF